MSLSTDSPVDRLARSLKSFAKKRISSGETDYCSHFVSSLERWMLGFSSMRVEALTACTFDLLTEEPISILREKINWRD